MRKDCCDGGKRRAWVIDGQVPEEHGLCEQERGDGPASHHRLDQQLPHVRLREGNTVWMTIQTSRRSDAARCACRRRGMRYMFLILLRMCSIPRCRWFCTASCYPPLVHSPGSTGKAQVAPRTRRLISLNKALSLPLSCAVVGARFAATSALHFRSSTRGRRPKL